ncbi:hypothetical protein F5051DRAFT_330834, partial [Lentinula edodes]
MVTETRSRSNKGRLQCAASLGYIRSGWYQARDTREKSMKASPWNRAVAYKFAEKAKEIVANCRDGRFGKAPIDWNKLFNDRLYTVYKDIIDARPLPGETKDDLVLRLALKQDKRKERSANRSI